MGYSNRNQESAKLEKFLNNFEDIFETGPMPLVIGVILCIIFNLFAFPCPLILKICLMVCGYVFLVFGIIKTFGNYD